MKKIMFLLLSLLTMQYPMKAQSMKKDLKTRLAEIEHRIAIKNVLDTFSILADQKETDKQTLLFTENATVESFMGGNSTGKLIGRKQIGATFAGFLKNFETVYHLNGQQTITINGNKAYAISYCLVILFSNENGKRIKTTFGVYYNDDFIFENNHWLISQRKSNFAWQDRQEVK